MKYAILGFVCIVFAVAVAGNWVYNPFAVQSIEDIFEPNAHYPNNDPADDVYHSNITYIPVKNISYIEYNYVWLNASGHAPDIERVRIYIKDSKVDHIALNIHYEWIDIGEFTIDGTHVNIYFAPVYHTPYVSSQSLISTSVNRMIPILIPLMLGIVLIGYDIRKKSTTTV